MGDPSVLTTDSPALRLLDPTKLQFGQPLAGNICTRSGRILVRAHRVFEREDLALLGDHLEQGMYGGPDWPDTFWASGSPPAAQEALDPGGAPEDPVAPPADSPQVRISDQPAAEGPAGTVTIPLTEVSVGESLPCAMHSRTGALLVPKGAQVTEQLLAKLGRMGITEVRIERQKPPAPVQRGSSTDLARVTTQLDGLLGDASRWKLNPIDPRQPRPRLSLAQLERETAGAQEVYVKGIDRVEEIAEDLLVGKPATLKAASEVITQFADMVQLDASLLPAVTQLKATPNRYLFTHGMNVALLSMAAAAEFGVPPEVLVEIGLGALLQDVGMLRLPEELRLAPRLFTPQEREEVNRHPIYSLEFLARMGGVSDIARLIAYQAHERPDGSGYPCQRNLTMIHPFSRLVAVADTYSAMVSHRPYRNAHSPNEAMEILVREASRGRHDRSAVLGLLNCLSVFPVGSYVRLSDGRVAQVLRSNPGRHTLPVVVPVGPDASADRAELDLASTEGLGVVQALAHDDDFLLRFFERSAG
ncbi:MAG: hypothetical protein GY842_26495 [bacterium]|nr:hypothetical protein [bacterium]